MERVLWGRQMSLININLVFWCLKIIAGYPNLSAFYLYRKQRNPSSSFYTIKSHSFCYSDHSDICFLLTLCLVSLNFRESQLPFSHIFRRKLGVSSALFSHNSFRNFPDCVWFGLSFEVSWPLISDQSFRVFGRPFEFP